MEEIEKLKVKHLEEIRQRNENTKVWIQSDTQCREYAHALEKERDQLREENKKFIRTIATERDRFGDMECKLKSENLQMRQQFQIISDHDEAWTHNCNEFVKDILKLPHTSEGGE